MTKSERLCTMWGTAVTSRVYPWELGSEVSGLCFTLRFRSSSDASKAEESSAWGCCCSLHHCRAGAGCAAGCEIWLIPSHGQNSPKSALSDS